jgi:hypothetical protein
MFDSRTSEIGYRGAKLCSEMIIRLTVHGELQLTWNELATDYFKVQLQHLHRGSMKNSDNFSQYSLFWTQNGIRHF